MKKFFNKKIYFLSLTLLITFLSLFIMFTDTDEKNYISYKNFINNIELSMVESVEIQDEYIYIKNIDDEKTYYTENPETNDFKEYLLLNDVKINKSFNEDDFTYILDALFYLIFFGAFAFGIYKITQFSNKDFKVIKNSSTKFSDIAGMDDIKKDMLKTVDILNNPQLYREKGIRPSKGIILEGPPGNGKTLFARALASEAKTNFIATKGADFQSAMMSIGPRKIKTLFKKARKNKPCIIFIDEFDGIGERRNYAGTGVDKENNRIITAMLNEMDGFSNEDGILVIGATNSYSSLDAALVRPGRFDKKYKISNPDKETIEKLIKMYTNKKNLDSNIKIDILVKCFEGLSCAAIETILNEAAVQSEIRNSEKMSIEDIVEAGKKTNTLNIKIK